MNTEDLNKRLLAVGEKIKAKGWESASVDIFVSYLAIFDRPPTDLDPMIYCRPSIRASLRDEHGIPSTHDFVDGAWDSKTIDQALDYLDEAAEKMPTADDEANRLKAAKSKLTESERRLLGVR